MTSYELLCDGRTHRWNGNIFMLQGVMYYMSDGEVEDCVAKVIVDLARLERLKAKK
jgi:hypothetical protein